MSRHDFSMTGIDSAAVLRRPGQRSRALVLALALVSLSGCVVGPDYHRPKQDMPAAFKEDAGWQPALPRDHVPRGEWWAVYNDPVLSQLMVQVASTNQTVAQAEAAYRQATASVKAAQAAYYPTLAVAPGITRSGVKQANSTTPLTTRSGESHNVTLTAGWEPDFWGLVHRQVEQGSATAGARAADLSTAILSAQAQLAQSYFQLRNADAERDILDRSVVNYRNTLDITRNQYAAGIVTDADVAAAESLWQSTQAQALDVGIARAQYEHAIAILVGQTPSQFSLAKVPAATDIPAVPTTGLPASLLERRPDVASAERQMIAANAAIGVAKAAYYPTLDLTASGALQAAGLGPWFSSPTRIWSLGSTLSETLFDGGKRLALTNQALAAYDQSAAFYRQTVLAAIQEVEDNLVALRVLESERVVQEKALSAARVSEKQTINQYKAGIVTYTAVLTAQTTRLNSENTLQQIITRQFLAHVLLIQALGGAATVDGQCCETPQAPASAS